jgi:hypothetical protein
MTDFSANASTLGYFYQSRYALFLLLNADIEAEISIEHFDDIAFEQDGSPIQLLQTKHHVENTGSLTNASTDLWKTLRVWSSAISANQLLATTILTLITTGRAPDETAASKLRPSNRPGRDVPSALKILKKTAQESESKTNKPAYDAFLSLSESQQYAMLNCVQILDSSSNIIDTRDLILKQLRVCTRPQFLELVYERTEGWWFNKVIQHLLDKNLAPISYNELLTKINDIQEEYFNDNLPIEFLNAIAPDEDALSKEQRIFIQQLRLIMVSEPRIRKAINDYYRAFSQRSKWMREDLLGIGELEKYEEKLIDEWERLHLIMKENLATETDDSKLRNEGRKLFNLIETKKEIPIRPRCTEPYVMRGSYHILANKLKIGWHVHFIDRLNELLSEDAC